MRIESVNIRGFGCLVDKRYEFPADGATLVIADNEAGKSTLAAAILATLCGFPKRKQAGEQIKLSDVYAPWNGDAYAVEMDICTDGKRLRIERDFAKGSFIVRDRDTGKDISASFEQDLASQFLHLPREDFQRIAFISGKEVPSFDHAETIQSRLSGLADGSAEDRGAEVAIAALDGARYTFETALTIPNAVKRLTGSIDEKRRALNTLDAHIEQAGEDARRLEESTTLQTELSVSLGDLDTEQQAARVAEQQTSARQMEALRMELAAGQAAARLAAIEQERRSAKLVAAAPAVLGVVFALVSFCDLVLGSSPMGVSIARTLIGIVIAAGCAVLAIKAGTAKADEKARLEREIEEARENLPSDEPGKRIRSSEEIEKEQRELRNELDSLSSFIIDLEKRVGSTVDSYRREYPKLNDDLRQLERELEKAQRFGSAIELAREALGEVAEDSHRRWAAALNESASAILPNLNPDYADLRFDDSLSFTIRRAADDRRLEQADIDARLSTGAKDQVYLAVRLAFCDELSRDGESVPVLLDDPLLAADDSRFASGMRYLAETFAKNHQVLILSCSKQRHEGLQREPWFDGNVHQLELEESE